LTSFERFICERENFVFDFLIYLKPVERFKNRSNRRSSWGTVSIALAKSRYIISIVPPRSSISVSLSTIEYGILKLRSGLGKADLVSSSYGTMLSMAKLVVWRTL